MTRHILFYTQAFCGGGAETVFARLAGALADDGDRVTFAADHAGPEPVADRRNLRHHLLGADHAAATRGLARLLREERPDASFSALGAQNLKHLAAATLAGRRHACVLGYHGFAAAEPRPFARASYWASPVTTQLAARSICVSDVLLEEVATRWRGSRARLVRVHNPLPAGPARRARPSAPPLILACGRLVPGKRFPDLVAALATVTPGDARLAILGEGAQRPAIEATVARLGLGERVTLPGHVDPAPWYEQASCVAIASESESFGLTALEALAHGVPVVSTRCGGPAEVLGPLGRLVPIGDVAALADALTRTLATPHDPIALMAHVQTFALPTIRDAYRAVADGLGGARSHQPARRRPS